jgi:dynein heavy chain
MHANANITFQQQETRDLLDAVVSIQPRISSAGGGAGGASSTDAIVAALCADILAQMPEDLSLEDAAPGLFDRSSSNGKLNSLSVVLGQEVERFRRLSGVMRASLAQLQAAIKGLVVMSEQLEAAYNALLSNEVRECRLHWRDAMLRQQAAVCTGVGSQGCERGRSQGCIF